jgi:hypothetical protein
VGKTGARARRLHASSDGCNQAPLLRDFGWTKTNGKVSFSDIQDGELTDPQNATNKFKVRFALTELEKNLAPTSNVVDSVIVQMAKYSDFNRDSYGTLVSTKFVEYINPLGNVNAKKAGKNKGKTCEEPKDVTCSDDNAQFKPGHVLTGGPSWDKCFTQQGVLVKIVTERTPAPPPPASDATSASTLASMAASNEDEWFQEPDNARAEFMLHMNCSKSFSTDKMGIEQKVKTQINDKKYEVAVKAEGSCKLTKTIECFKPEFYGQCKADDKHNVGQLGEIFTKYTDISNLFSVKCIRSASTETHLSKIQFHVVPAPDEIVALSASAGATGGSSGSSGSVKTEFKYWVNNTNQVSECDDVPAALENGYRLRTGMTCVLCNKAASATGMAEEVPGGTLTTTTVTTTGGTPTGGTPIAATGGTTTEGTPIAATGGTTAGGTTAGGTTAGGTSGVSGTEGKTCRNSDLGKFTFNRQKWGKTMAETINELIQTATTLLQLKCAYKTLQY